MSDHTLRHFPDRAAMSAAAAGLFAAKARAAVLETGRFLVALSGGGTPQGMFDLLGADPAFADLPWSQTHVFWGDERLVPPDQPGSSYKQAWDAFLQHRPIPPEHIHRALGEADTAAAVADCRTRLQQVATPEEAGWPRFDLILLGMGRDGHTASLFPGPLPAEALAEPVIGVQAEYDGRPAHRITFTPPLINRARNILFLVAGANKAEALDAVLHGPHNPEKWPAQRIKPSTWFVVNA